MVVLCIARTTRWPLSTVTGSEHRGHLVEFLRQHNTAVAAPGAKSCQLELDRDAGYCAAQAALKSNHTGGINIVLCDGSVAWLNNAIDITVYKDLADREDGNPIGSFE